MPQVQSVDGRDRRSMAQALAEAVAVMPDERAAGSAKEGRVKRLCELAQEIAAVVAFCIGAFWIIREILVITR